MEARKYTVLHVLNGTMALGVCIRVFTFLASFHSKIQLITYFFPQSTMEL